MNEPILLLILPVLLAYILGSVPTALWAGQWFFGLDIRKHGSKNAGATNVYRVLGTWPAVAVLLVDAFKGVGAVGLAYVFRDAFDVPLYFIVYQFVLGFVALIGHVFPILAGFRGGKGVATLSGMVLVMFPMAVLIGLAVFLLAFLPTRYVSLGSLCAALSFPLTVLFVLPETLWPEILFSFLVVLLVWLTHLGNIRRLFRGEENRIRFRQKK